jgi:hypothetical protein
VNASFPRGLVGAVKHEEREDSAGEEGAEAEEQGADVCIADWRKRIRVEI